MDIENTAEKNAE